MGNVTAYIQWSRKIFLFGVPNISLKKKISLSISLQKLNIFSELFLMCSHTNMAQIIGFHLNWRPFSLGKTWPAISSVISTIHYLKQKLSWANYTHEVATYLHPQAVCLISWISLCAATVKMSRPNIPNWFSWVGATVEVIFSVARWTSERERETHCFAITKQ